MLIALPCAESWGQMGRIWKSKDGKHELRARLVRADRDTATLETADGRIVRVPLADLRTDAREYIGQWRDEEPVPGIIPDSLGDPIDLLARVDLEKHLVRGAFRRDGKVLASSPDKVSIVEAPIAAPTQYQLRMVAKRVANQGSLAVAVPIGKHQGLLVFDALNGGRSGLVWIDGLNEPRNSTHFRQGVLKTGRDAEFIITVNNGRIHATCDGRTIVEWCGAPSRLTLDRRWWSNVPDGQIMLNAWNAEYHISTLELRAIEQSEVPRDFAEGKAALPGASVALVEHPMGHGTGFLAAPNLLVTNHHVIQNALTKDIRILFPQQNQPLKAQAVLHADAKHDLAILSVRSSRTPLPIGWDGRFLRNSAVEIYGNPAVGGDVTLRNARLEGSAKELMRVNEMDVIQLDANVNPGASGGPILNELGQVIGVTVMKATDEGEQIIREGLQRLNREPAASPSQMGVAFGIPGSTLAAAIDQVRGLAAGEAARVSQTHDHRVHLQRLATLAGVYRLEALANVPDLVYAQAQTLRNAGAISEVALLSPDERKIVKAALESEEFQEMVKRLETHLDGNLWRVETHHHVPPELRRDANRLRTKLEEFKRFATRPGSEYQRFAASMERFESEWKDIARAASAGLD